MTASRSAGDTMLRKTEFALKTVAPEPDGARRATSGGETSENPENPYHIRARLTSRCDVVGARQRASSTFRTFGLSRTSLALGIIPILEL